MPRSVNSRRAEHPAGILVIVSDAAHATAKAPAEVACISCGYDLRGLAADGPCPECGTPIERSVRGDLLAFADPAWLGRIARGQKWLAWGMLIIVLAAVAHMLTIFAPHIVNALPLGQLAAAAVFGTLMRVVPLGLQAGAITATIGAFLVTARDPRETLREKPLSARNAARGAMSACLVLIALRIAVGLTPLGGGLAVTAAFLLLIFAAVVAAVLSLLTCLRALARRTGDDALVTLTEKRTARLRWFLPVFFGVAIANRLLGPAIVAAGGGPAPPFLVILSIVAFVLMIAMLVELDTFTRLMFACRRAFDRCAANVGSSDRA
jgi:predicted RNA-binding Zn-ribbon protein involved in translation (DUF1610 family)